MKVRIGYGLGNLRALDGARLAPLADGLERHGFDSLWLSERATGPAPDPLVALAFVAGRTRRLKLGTSVQVLPGRSPALLAKEWASLDQLSGGRALPAVGLGVADPGEQQAFGVQRAERAAWFEEALPLLRRFWNEEHVTHSGERFHYDRLAIRPQPTKPLDVWLGGKAPGELRRVGRLGDGWLASFTPPAACAAARTVIEDAAATAGRTMDPEHYGAMVFYGHEPLPERLRRAIEARTPGTDAHEIVATGWDGLRERCEAYIGAGFSKLVLVPFAEPTDWDDELAAAAESVLPLERTSS